MFLNFYRLREQPFGVTPDPAYLYASRTHCEALDSLTESILADRGFIALIAEPGMGKTTLLYQVLDGLRDSARAVFLFQTQCNSREFLQYLMSELGVDASSMGLVAMHNKLNEILFAEMLAGRRFVLIVDEAQNLDASVLETIRLLSNFETPHSKLMQIVLSGQSQLGEKLEQKELAQLLQRITVIKRLEALSPDETAGYIRHRLKIAGHYGDDLFQPSALALIAERSHGIPRNINKICFRALLEGYAAGSQTLCSDIVEKATQRLEFLAATHPSPKVIAMPAPPAAPSTTDLEEPNCPSSAPQLTYQSPATRRLPSWGLWAGALIAVLLTAGFALPHNAAQGIARMMRKEITTTRSVAERSQELSDTRANVESKKNGHDTSSVTAISASSTGNDAQIVVMLDGGVEYESARISSPDRIYFDLRNARLGSSVGQKTIPVEDGLLKWVRAAQNTDNVVRLVLDAGGARDFSAKLLTDPYRLVIAVHAQSSVAWARDSNSNSTTQEGSESAVAADPWRRGKLSLARELGLKISRIAIDPGHGGYDTGTAGPHGLLEKNLCLDVALRLGQLIDQDIPGAQVIYTRKDDRHVPLEERTAIANDANADLFISIHANSSDIRSTRGVETYYVNLATSQESRNLATRENFLAESSLHDLPDLLKKITRNDKLAESKLFATDIQNALSQRLQLVSSQETNRGVKQAPFIVLTGANMPAVLSEISFVSNASDESLLLESGQRQQIAEGLFRGIANYLDGMQSPPYPRQRLVSENHAVTPGLHQGPESKR
jgi:N-acetylmuramoyl-L-alanine amidase/type II secretory pathway predicted ATPase ExeA